MKKKITILPSKVINFDLRENTNGLKAHLISILDQYIFMGLTCFYVASILSFKKRGVCLYCIN